MNTYKLLIFSVLFFLLGLCTPDVSNAQDSILSENVEELWEQTPVSDNVSTDVEKTDKKDDDKDKKKKKDKDIVKLNTKFFYNLLIDLATVLIIIFLIYYPSNKKLGFVFTFILFNVVIFLLT